MFICTKVHVKEYLKGHFLNSQNLEIIQISLWSRTDKLWYVHIK